MDFVTEDGEVIRPEDIEFAYTREGRRVVGKEFPNPTPIAPPLGFVPTPPVHELIAAMVMRGVQEQMQRERGEDLESPEDADDFDVDDDFDPSSPYEHDFEPTDPWPASRAVLQLEQAIAERRNQDRIATLRQELEALSNGRPWPPEPAPQPDQGGGGTQSPSARLSPTDHPD